MKKLLTIIFLALAFTGESQTYNQLSTTYGSFLRRIRPDSTLHIPTFNGAPVGVSSLRSTQQDRGAFYYDSAGKKVYIFHPKDLTWTLIGGSSIAWDSVTGKPVNFSTTYALSNDVRDSIQSRVPYENATRNLIMGNYRVSARTLLGDSIMARGSGGISVYSNSGTHVALFGAGGGSGTTLYGGLNGTTGTFSGVFNVTNTTASTSSSTGALVVGGGIGVGESGINGVRIHRGAANDINSLGIGTSALSSTTTGQLNVAVGISAMVLTTTGGSNTAVGGSALGLNTTGGSNTAVGASSLTGNISGNSNSALGRLSLFALNSGSDNTALGFNAIGALTSGSSNIAIGSGTGNLTNGGATVTTLNNSVLIGSDTRPSANSNTNETVIGFQARGNGSNTVTIGNSSVTNNYFSGNVRANQFTKGFPSDANRAFAASGGADSIALYMEEYGNGASSPDVFFYKGRGTLASRSNVQSGDNLISIVGGGYVDAALNPSIDILGRVINVNTTNDRADADFIVRQTFNGTTFNENLLVQANGGNVVVRGGGTFGGNVGIGTTSPTERLHLQSSQPVIRYTKTGIVNWFVGNVTGNNFAINTDATAFDEFTINTGGEIIAPSVYTATVGGTNRDVFVDNTGLIGYVSSFRASKKNIAPLAKTDWLHKLNPVTFNYRIKDAKGKYTDSAYKEKEYGLVAEEVETVNPEMVFYDVDSTGKHLRGVHYSKLIIPLLKEIQDQKKRIDAQQTAIEALIKRIELLEKK